jgi:hypothetical protein
MGRVAPEKQGRLLAETTEKGIVQSPCQTRQISIFGCTARLAPLLRKHHSTKNIMNISGG